jgi:hypothetical protein
MFRIRIGFNADTGPAMRIRISFRIHGYDYQKLKKITAEKDLCFLTRNCN